MSYANRRRRIADLLSEYRKRVEDEKRTNRVEESFHAGIMPVSVLERTVSVVGAVYTTLRQDLPSDGACTINQESFQEDHMHRTRFTVATTLLVLFALAVSTQIVAQKNSNTPAVTFNKDVLPILQKNCQTCHRPGEIAPMSFLNYKETRPWAKAIKTAVVNRQMPPWFADPAYGHFANDRRLSDSDIRTLSAWADTDAVEGDEKDKPAPIAFQDGWNIKPDMIIEMPKEFKVPAKGTVAYQNFLVKVNFPEDVWVVAAEMRPGDRRVLHHGRVLIR